MDSYGYRLNLFGGEGSQGIVSEMHYYSTILETWTKNAKHQAEIFLRTSFCFASNHRDMIEYGGITNDGPSSELWTYSLDRKIFKLMSPSGDLPPVLRNFNCFIES
jgi:hypothetical protein